MTSEIPGWLEDLALLQLRFGVCQGVRFHCDHSFDSIVCKFLPMATALMVMVSAEVSRTLSHQILVMKAAAMLPRGKPVIVIHSHFFFFAIFLSCACLWLTIFISLWFGVGALIPLFLVSHLYWCKRSQLWIALWTQHSHMLGEIFIEMLNFRVAFLFAPGV